MSLRMAAVFAALLLVVATSASQAQTFTVLYTFQRPTSGDSPLGRLFRDTAGNLYGTTAVGGHFQLGTVFKLDNTGTETVLHSFAGAPNDGSQPYAGLVPGKGVLYGTTIGGGAFDAGTVFSLSRTGITILYSFSGGTDGGSPEGEVVQDQAGNLYGTSANGGAFNYGVVFKLDPAGAETVLHAFGGYPTDGQNPYGGLIRDANGNLYGTTNVGGIYGFGTVFRIDSTGNETILHNFNYTVDLAWPYGTLAMDAEGSLYGTTSACRGTVYKLDRMGNETILYAFPGSCGGSDGGPFAGVVRDTTGNLYGTTLLGGDSSCGYFGAGCGTVFKLDPSGNETVLHAFTGRTDGYFPVAGVILDGSGNVYGTTQLGGDLRCSGSGCGVVFKITP